MEKPSSNLRRTHLMQLFRTLPSDAQNLTMRTGSQRKSVVDIVIVNWNSGSQLEECVSRVETAMRETFEIGRIVVVDNASNDSSVDGLSIPGLRLIIVRNSTNRGFAAACNQGAEIARADYLLFLNPDVQLTDNSMSVPIQFLERPENANVAICGPRLIDHCGVTQKTCARFPTTKAVCSQALGLNRIMPNQFRLPLMAEWEHNHDRAVDQVIGACLFVRGDVFRELGGFDERFFLYFDEVDLCLRCRILGHEVYYLSEAKAQHSGGGCTKQIPGKRLFYLLQSRMLYALKHFSPWSAAALCLVTMFVEPFSRCAVAFVHGSVMEFRSVLEGYRLLWSSLPSLVRSRKGAPA